MTTPADNRNPDLDARLPFPPDSRRDDPSQDPISRQLSPVSDFGGDGQHQTFLDDDFSPRATPYPPVDIPYLDHFEPPRRESPQSVRDWQYVEQSEFNVVEPEYVRREPSPEPWPLVDEAQEVRSETRQSQTRLDPDQRQRLKKDQESGKSSQRADSPEPKRGLMRGAAKGLKDLASNTWKWAKSPSGKKVLGVALGVTGLVVGATLAGLGVGAAIGGAMMIGGAALYMNGRSAQKREDAAKFQAEQSSMSAAPYAGMPMHQQPSMHQQQAVTLNLSDPHSIRLQMGGQELIVKTAQVPTNPARTQLGNDPMYQGASHFAATSPLAPEAHQHMTSQNAHSQQSAERYEPPTRTATPNPHQQPVRRTR